MDIKHGQEYLMQYYPPWLRNIRNQNFYETLKTLSGLLQSALGKCKCYQQYTADLFTNAVVQNAILCAKNF